MKSPYNEVVMDHFMNPRNMGEMPSPSGVGEIGNPSCGDMMRLYVQINENDIIEDIKFQTFGCGAAIASSSMTSELVKGKTVEQALKLTNQDVVDALGGVPEVKIHCSIMAEEALESAIRDFFTQAGRDVTEIDKIKSEKDSNKH